MGMGLRDWGMSAISKYVMLSSCTVCVGKIVNSLWFHVSFREFLPMTEGCVISMLVFQSTFASQPQTHTVQSPI